MREWTTLNIKEDTAQKFLDLILVTNTSQNPLIVGAYHVQIEALSTDDADANIRNWSDIVLETIFSAEKGAKLNDAQRKHICRSISDFASQKLGRRVGLSFYGGDRGSIKRTIFIAGRGYTVPLNYKVRFDTYDGGIVTDVEDYYFSAKVDSDGNYLSLEQEEYFKNSFARDKNGNLLLVYYMQKKHLGLQFHIMNMWKCIKLYMTAQEEIVHSWNIIMDLLMAYFIRTMTVPDISDSPATVLGMCMEKH